MSNEVGFFRKHWIDLAAVVIALIALGFSIVANREAKKQNLYTAVQVQVDSCNVSASSGKFGVREDMGKEDKPQARTKAAHLAKCFSVLSFTEPGIVYKEMYVEGYEGFELCVQSANAPTMYLNEAGSESVC